MVLAIGGHGQDGTRGGALLWLLGCDSLVDRCLSWLPMVFNLGRFDRALRIVLGLAIGLAGILISGHPNLGRALGVLGALTILSGACGS